MKNVYLILVLIFLTVSCSKDNPNQSNELLPNIFLAGWSKNNSQDSNRATIWKNGEATILTDGSTDAVINSIYVNNNDTYTVGEIITNTSTLSTQAKYWKNGIEQNLNISNTTSSSLVSVVVSNNDVYVLGYQIVSGSNNIIKYWKNGVVTNITNGSTDAIPTDIQVQNSDVYITYNEGNFARLWKNGVITNLSDGTTIEKTVALKINNNDVYILGRKNQQIKYWKNGLETYINTTGSSGAFCLDVSNGNIYIGGYENNKPQFWKNGLPQNDVSSSVAGGYISCIKYFNDKIYCAGNQNGVKLWYNNTSSIISSNNFGSDVYSLFIKD